MVYGIVRIKIKTSVKQDLHRVIEGFDDELFIKLNPPFPKVKLLQFDGCKEGDTVALELNFFLFRQKWVSKITEDLESEGAFYFIDEGIEMPLFRYWRHKHLLEAQEGKTLITDDICFKTRFILFDCLLYPLLYLQFKYRTPIYQSVFG